MEEFITAVPLLSRRTDLTSPLWMRPGCCAVQNICLSILDCCILRSLFTFSNRLILRVKEPELLWKQIPNVYLLHFVCVRPLADNEKLPVRSHRAAEPPKSPAEDGDTVSQEPKKKSSKEKREKKDKDRERKVRRKKNHFFYMKRLSFILQSW